MHQTVSLQEYDFSQMKYLVQYYNIEESFLWFIVFLCGLFPNHWCTINESKRKRNESFVKQDNYFVLLCTE